MTELWVTEKPSSRNALAKVLGVVRDNTNGPFGHYVTRRGIVVNNIGHLLDKVSPAKIDPKWSKWSYDTLPIAPDDIPLEPDPGKIRQLKEIERLFREVKPTRVILAGDAGREGSRIGRETVVDWIGYKGPLDRMGIVSYEEDDIRQAITAMEKDPGAIDRDYRADLEAQARGTWDYWLGMTASVIASLRTKPRELGFKEKFNAGGVVSALTKLVVDRERAIRNHVPRDFHHVAMEVATGGTGTPHLTLKYAPGVVPKTGEDRRLYDPALAGRLKEVAAAWSGRLAVEAKPERIGPPLLLDKARLAAAAAKSFGWAPTKTAKVAQGLYDAGYISYPRGECLFLRNEQMGQAPKILRNLASIEEIGKVVGPALDGDRIVVRKGSRYNSAKVGEHYATVPTTKFPKLSDMDGDQRALYLVIAKNFAANHLPDAVDEVTRISADISLDNKTYPFAITGRVPKEPGWRAIYGAGLEADESLGRTGKVGGATDVAEEQGRLPPVADGSAAKAVDATVLTLQTTPPPRYKLGDLENVMKHLADQFEDPAIKTLLNNPYDPEEAKGLGTAATRDDMIDKALNVLAYIDVVPGKGGKDGKAVRPTAKGEAHAQGWEQRYCSLLDPVGRALLEGELAEIGLAASNDEARRRHQDFLARGRERIHQMVDDFRDVRPVTLPRSADAAEGESAHGGPAAHVGPSPKALQFARDLLKKDGVKPKEAVALYGADWSSDPAACKKIIDERAPAKASERPASEKQAETVRSVASRNGIDEAGVVAALKNAATAGAFLDTHLRSRSSSSGRPSGGASGPGARGASSSKGAGVSRGSGRGRSGGGWGR